jgi:hypothetical protein
MAKKKIDYSPLAENEWIEAQSLVEQITTFIPDDKMNAVWHLYLTIAQTKEPKPCKCASAAKHWGKAMDTIRTFVKKVNG